MLLLFSGILLDMDIVEKLLKSQEEEAKQLELETKDVDISTIATDLSSVVGIGSYPKKKTADFLNSSTGWVFACVDSIANEVANIDIKLFKQSGKNVVEIDQHPILDLLARANQATTKFDLFAMTQQYLELTGEAPWFLEFEGNKPVGIFLLDPSRLTVLPPKKDGELIGGYKYKVFKDSVASEVMLEPFEVIFLRYPDPTTFFRGKGTLQAVVKSFDIDETAENYNLRFFTNAATPNSILSTDKRLAKETLKKLKKDLEEKYEGWQKAHKTLILEGGLNWQSMALSQKEMDFIDTMKFTRDKILAIFRVPRSILGITEDVNRANAEASEFVFSKRTVKPKMQKLVEMLNEFLVPMFDTTGTLFLDFSDPVPEDVNANRLLAESGVTKGYLSVNEARAVMGYDPVVNGDEIREPVVSNVAPTRSLNLKGKRKKFTPSKWHNYSNKSRSRVLRETKRKDETVRNIVKQTVTEIAKSMIEQKIKEKKSKHKIFSSDAKEAKKQKYAFQAKQLRVGEELEQRFAGKFRSILEDQKQLILSKIPNKVFKITPQQAKQFHDLIDVDFWINETIGKMTPAVASTIEEQSRLAFQLLGQSGVLIATHEEVAKYLKKRTFRFSTEITKTTNAKYQTLLSKAVEDGDSIVTMRKSIQGLFNDMKGYRAERIARSEVIRATTFADDTAWQDSGVVEAKEWLAFIDERTDDECIALDGKTISLGKNYFDRGDTFGNMVLDYEDLPGPPLHSNCRCTLVPVVKA